MNASKVKPAPNSRAMTLSRTKPVTRLISTAKDTIPADRATLSGGAGFSGVAAGIVSGVTSAAVRPADPGAGNHDACPRQPGAGQKAVLGLASTWPRIASLSPTCDSGVIIIVNFQTKGLEERLSKEDSIEVTGTVVEKFPSGLFSVQLDQERIVLAHLAGKLRRNRIRVLAGDRVTLEMSPYDLTKGRITYRHK